MKSCVCVHEMQPSLAGTINDELDTAEHLYVYCHV